MFVSPVSVFQDGTIGGCPFTRPLFVALMRKAFFQGGARGKGSIASSNYKRFISSDCLKPNELEIPEPMVALAAAAVSSLCIYWAVHSLTSGYFHRSTYPSMTGYQALTEVT